MKAQKKLKLFSPALPGLAVSPAAKPKVGTTRHSDEAGSGGGRLGRAMKDARATESATPAPKIKGVKARAVARWENEGGRGAKAAAIVGSTKKSPATKPARTTSALRIEESLDAKTNPATLARGAKKEPRNTGPVGLDATRQRKAEARAKDSQIERSGLDSRQLGHVSASGKRAQARRDSKN